MISTNCSACSGSSSRQTSEEANDLASNSHKRRRAPVRVKVKVRPVTGRLTRCSLCDVQVDPAQSSHGRSSLALRPAWDSPGG